MKLHNTVNAPAVYGNGVSNLGEFKIRASAKAFNILSSGLYANKIKAIIREIGCNAVDSHVAAGKSDVPFDVHLPNMLEPYFYIRDYGTGLSHDEVTKIYTTYFESTKTDSNDYIGALGLGSKSPFSYTDNFTITAIKNGRKGIYSAFISESGFPSIMLMTEHETDEPSGVEVRFSVNDYADFRRFSEEARNTYIWFKLKPNIVSCTDTKNFLSTPIEYALENVIPGVHVLRTQHLFANDVSFALMGNIAYPIELQHFGKTEIDSGVSYQSLLRCNLVMEFNIGELDFQASREGLSYIPLTIENIKRKLRELSAALEGVVAADMSVYPEDDVFNQMKVISKHANTSLMKDVVREYIQKVYPIQNGLSCSKTNPYFLTADYLNLQLREEDAKKFNINVNQYHIDAYRPKKPKIRSVNKEVYKRINEEITLPDGTLKPNTILLLQNNIRLVTVFGHSRYYSNNKNSAENLGVGLENNIQFVVHETNKELLSKIRTHVRVERQAGREVLEDWLVLQAVDDTKPMDLDGFMKFIKNPTNDNIINSKNLSKNVSSGVAAKKKRSIDAYVLEIRTNRYNDVYFFNNRNRVDINKIKEPIKWYVPLDNGVPVDWIGSISDFIPAVLRADPNIAMEAIFGLNKTCVKTIAGDSTWVNLYDHIKNMLLNIPQSEIDDATNFLVYKEIQPTCFSEILEYNSGQGCNKINPNSPILGLQKYMVKDRSVAEQVNRKIDACQKLLLNVGLTNLKIQTNDLVESKMSDWQNIKSMYSLLKYFPTHFRYSNVEVGHMINYINATDSEV